MSFTGNTETRIGESSSGYYYNETLINTNLQYGAFTNWIQLEYSDPPELGRSINGVRKLRLEYDNGPIIKKVMFDLEEPPATKDELGSLAHWHLWKLFKEIFLQLYHFSNPKNEEFITKFMKGDN